MADRLSDQQRREIEHDCTALMHRYAVNADHHFERFSEVFADDALWIRPGMEMRGREDIQGFMNNNVAQTRAAKPSGHLTRHLMTTIRIEAVDADHATGVSYALVFRDEAYTGELPVPMNTIELVVEYRNEFTRTPAGWRISRHEAQHIFRR